MNLNFTTELAQDQLDNAVLQYISNQIPVKPNSKVEIKYVAGRKGNGTTATVTIQNTSPTAAIAAPPVKRSKAVEKSEPVVTEQAPEPVEEVVEAEVPLTEPVDAEPEEPIIEELAPKAKKSLFND